MNKNLIVFATLTGNTQIVANSLFNALTLELPTAQFELLNIAEYKPGAFSPFSTIVFGASTWSDDGLNPDTSYFLETLKKEKPNLSPIHFALFGLGDSSFEEFCKALPVLRQALETHGAKVYEKDFTIDGIPSPNQNKELLEWAKEFFTSQ